MYEKKLVPCDCCGRENLVHDPIHIYDRIHDGMCIDCTDICDKAIEAITIARRAGAETGYTVDSWRESPSYPNMEHVLTHIFKHRRGDQSEDHLAHAICRLVMEYARGQS